MYVPVLLLALLGSSALALPRQPLTHREIPDFDAGPAHAFLSCAGNPAGFVCVGTTRYTMCGTGTAPIDMAVAAGTECRDGKIVAAAPVAAEENKVVVTPVSAEEARRERLKKAYLVPVEGAW